MIRVIHLANLGSAYRLGATSRRMSNGCQTARDMSRSLIRHSYDTQTASYETSQIVCFVMPRNVPTSVGPAPLAGYAAR